jgi:hypothetical protein
MFDDCTAKNVRSVSLLRELIGVLLRHGMLTCVVGLLAFGAESGLAQTALPDLSTNDQNVSGEQNVDLSSNPTANVTVQSISGGGASYRMTPNAPGMPSFAGGPCIGTSVSASGAIPGVSFGGGASKEDDACQRRNWVQALIGASQHMSSNDALFMKRLAFEVMRDDEYLAPAFARLGVAPTIQPTRSKAGAAGPEASKGSEPRTRSAPEPRPIARASKSCVTVLAESAPAQMKSLLSRQGCEVIAR